MRTHFQRNLFSWSTATWILIVSHCISILLVFPDYGITNDEDGLRLYGNAVIGWYFNLFQDDRILEYSNLKYYGGFAETLLQIPVNIALLSGFPFIFEIRHLCTAFFGLVAVFFAARTGTLLGGPRAGFIAALFLILTPRFFGHSFNNSKDIPFAALYICSLFLILRLHISREELSSRIFVKCGIVLGMALGVRIGALLLIGYFGLLAGWVIIREKSTSLRIWVFWNSIAALFIAWCVMLLFWPYAQTDPISAPLESLSVMSRFPWDRLTFFNGLYYRAGELPSYYLPVWFIITLPEFYFWVFSFFLLFLLKVRISHLVGESDRKFFLNLRILWERVKTDPGLDRYVSVALLWISFLTPIILPLAMGSVLYDGMRHFLFSLPILAVLGALAFNWVVDNCSSRFRIFFVLGVLASLVITFYDAITLHPYQTVYFNRLFAGGLPYAARRFETDYWGNSYREGAHWVKKNFKKGKDGRPLRILSCASFMKIEYVLNKENFVRDEKELLLKVLGLDKKPVDRFLFRDTESFYLNHKLGWIHRPDLFLSTTRFNCHKKVGGKVLHRIERKGVPLLYIIEPEYVPTGFEKIFFLTP